MATAIQKITLSTSRDIPFNKLVLSPANVRRVKAGISIEELAEDIARRTLLQSLSVRAVVDANGIETGMFEVPAGGRRFRALELLVKQKRLAKTAPVPCVVREGGLAEEDSLAENVQRVVLHPLDQFRAFLALREKGLSDEEIAARFFVNTSVREAAPPARATDFPYGHSAGLRRLVGETADFTEEEAATFEALRNEYETLEAEHVGGDDLPEAVDQRLGEIETAMAAFENRPVRFDPAEIARAGIFVSIDGDGSLRIERGLVRPEDEVPDRTRIERDRRRTRARRTAGPRSALRHYRRWRADECGTRAAGGGRHHTAALR